MRTIRTWLRWYITPAAAPILAPLPRPLVPFRGWRARQTQLLILNGALK